MKKGLTVLSFAVLVQIFICACSKQTPSNSVQQTGNISESSDLAAVQIEDENIVKPVEITLVETPAPAQIAEANTEKQNVKPVQSTPAPAVPVQKTQTAAATNPAEQPKQEPRKTPQQLFEEGTSYHDQKEYDKAIASFSEAIKMNPNYTEAYVYRSHSYNNKGDLDRALADLNTALKIKPKDIDALYYRGSAYNRKNDLDLAIADWEAVLRIDPDHELAKMMIRIAMMPPLPPPPTPKEVTITIPLPSPQSE